MIPLYSLQFGLGLMALLSWIKEDDIVYLFTILGFAYFTIHNLVYEIKDEI